MTDRAYFAFPASNTLAFKAEQFLADVAQQVPVDYQLLGDIIDHFIDEMVQAFFVAPVEVFEADSERFAAIVISIAGAIRKLAKKLARRLLGNIDSDEQQRLAAYINTLLLPRGSLTLVGFPLNAAQEERLQAVFVRELDVGAEADDLLEVMNDITDSALIYFLDGNLATLKLGRFTRGLVATGRIAMKKASYSANNHMVGLPWHLRKQVAKYYQSLTLNIEQ